MAYTVHIKPSAQKDLDDLPDKETDRVLKKITQLETEPRPIGIQKLSDAEGYRIRSGNYRILFTIDDQRRDILIYRIKHRKDVYR